MATLPTSSPTPAATPAPTPTPMPDWAWLSTTPAEWARTWIAAMSGAPASLVQPILPGWNVSPTFNINSGNSAAPQTEAEVVQRFSYGRQLGRMADALAALVDRLEPAQRTKAPFKDFMEMKTQIDSIKLDAAAARIERLHADLLALKAAGSPDYDRLKASLRQVLR